MAQVCLKNLLVYVEDVVVELTKHLVKDWEDVWILILSLHSGKLT